MKITKRGEYALKTLLALSAAYPKRTVSLREIAEQENLPVKFLEQIMITLKQTGFVNSTKGKMGGYSLARAPQDIRLGEIIRVIDGPLAPLTNAMEIRKQIQKEERHPGLYATFLEVRDAVSDIIDKRTLADVCEKSLEIIRAKSSSPMYYI